MTLTYDLYWSFRSPYSYLVTPRLVALEREFDVRCVARPVYPHAIRMPHLFKERDALWLSYFKTDIVRTAAFLGLPIAWPRPDPVVMDAATGAYPLDQPHIHRLTRLGAAAAEAGQGLLFLHEVSQLLWSPETQDWTAIGLLQAATARAGLDLKELDQKVAHDPEKYEAIVQRNQSDEAAAGHWGVPLMVFEGEPFFGQDRLDQLIWRMHQRGLQRRLL